MPSDRSAIVPGSGATHAVARVASGARGAVVTSLFAIGLTSACSPGGPAPAPAAPASRAVVAGVARDTAAPMWTPATSIAGNPGRAGWPSALAPWGSAAIRGLVVPVTVDAAAPYSTAVLRTAAHAPAGVAPAIAEESRGAVTGEVQVLPWMRLSRRAARPTRAMVERVLKDVDGRTDLAQFADAAGRVRGVVITVADGRRRDARDGGPSRALSTGDTTANAMAPEAHEFLVHWTARQASRPTRVATVVVLFVPRDSLRVAPSLLTPALPAIVGASPAALLVTRADGKPALTVQARAALGWVRIVPLAISNEYVLDSVPSRLPVVWVGEGTQEQITRGYTAELRQRGLMEVRETRQRLGMPGVMERHVSVAQGGLTLPRPGTNRMAAPVYPLLRLEWERTTPILQLQYTAHGGARVRAARAADQIDP